MLTHLPLFQGDRRSNVVLITVALNQLDGFPNLFHSFWQDIQASPELLQTFIRLLAKVIVILDIKLQGVQSLVLWYRRSTHFTVNVGDISIVDAKFERILKVFNFFFQSSNFGFEAYIFLKRANIRTRHRGKNCMNAEWSNICPHTSLAVIRISK